MNKALRVVVMVLLPLMLFGARAAVADWQSMEAIIQDNCPKVPSIDKLNPNLIARHLADDLMLDWVVKNNDKLHLLTDRKPQPKGVVKITLEPWRFADAHIDIREIPGDLPIVEFTLSLSCYQPRSWALWSDWNEAVAAQTLLAETVKDVRLLPFLRDNYIAFLVASNLLAANSQDPQAILDAIQKQRAKEAAAQSEEIIQLAIDSASWVYWPVEAAVAVYDTQRYGDQLLNAVFGTNRRNEPRVFLATSALLGLVINFPSLRGFRGYPDEGAILYQGKRGVPENDQLPFAQRFTVDLAGLKLLRNNETYTKQLKDLLHTGRLRVDEANDDVVAALLGFQSVVNRKIDIPAAKIRGFVSSNFDQYKLRLARYEEKALNDMRGIISESYTEKLMGVDDARFFAAFRYSEDGPHALPHVVGLNEKVISKAAGPLQALRDVTLYRTRYLQELSGFTQMDENLASMLAAKLVAERKVQEQPFKTVVDRWSRFLGFSSARDEVALFVKDVTTTRDVTSNQIIVLQNVQDVIADAVARSGPKFQMPTEMIADLEGAITQNALQFLEGIYCVFGDDVKKYGDLTNLQRALVQFTMNAEATMNSRPWKLYDAVKSILDKAPPAKQTAAAKKGLKHLEAWTRRESPLGYGSARFYDASRYLD